MRIIPEIAGACFGIAIGCLVGGTILAQSGPAELPSAPSVAAITQGRNVIVTCQGPATARLCVPSAMLMELPQSPRDGQKPTCNDAAQGYVWFTRGSAAADSRTEVCEWRGGTIAWRVK